MLNEKVPIIRLTKWKVAVLVNNVFTFARKVNSVNQVRLLSSTNELAVWAGVQNVIRRFQISNSNEGSIVQD